MSHSNTVVTFPTVPPKTVTYKHRGQQITITFEPDTRRWNYVVEFIRPVHLPSTKTEKDINAAKRKAERLVDKLLDGE